MVTQGASLRAMHTPGHATDHCCFLLEEEAALFTGDNVLGVGSAVITELDSYMASLQRMADCQPRRLYPGHGPAVEDGPAKLREYQAHRLARIQQVRVSVRGRAAPDSSLASPRLRSCGGRESVRRRAALRQSGCVTEAAPYPSRALPRPLEKAWSVCPGAFSGKLLPAQVRSFMVGLGAGRAVTAMGVARALYAGTPESLMEGAAHNVLVVLRALLRQGVVACSDVGRPAHTSTFTAAMDQPHQRL